ncbi:hypothetical protein HDU98_010197 [Podochytrium sp. JEL0797]|nr:hypothetical protein HDU98_010197 [Podochytrium sp. JEL0797]
MSSNTTDAFAGLVSFAAPSNSNSNSNKQSLLEREKQGTPWGVSHTPLSAPKLSSPAPLSKPSSGAPSPRVANASFGASSVNQSPRLAASKDAFADLLSLTPQTSLNQRSPAPNNNLPLNEIANKSQSPVSLHQNQFNNAPLIHPTMMMPHSQNLPFKTPSKPNAPPPAASNDIWNFDALNSSLATTSTASPPASSSATSAFDPFGLDFAAPAAATPAPTSNFDNHHQQPIDDPFGILTGTPTPIKPILPPRNDTTTPSPRVPTTPKFVTPPSRPMHSTTPTSPRLSNPGSHNNNDAQVAAIVDMGFSAPEASRALRLCDGDVEGAIGLLVSGGMSSGVSSRGEMESFGQQQQQQAGQGWSQQSNRFSDDDWRPAEIVDNSGSGGGGGRKGGGGWGVGGLMEQESTKAVFSNAKQFLQFGREKLTKAYEVASVKVAAVVEGLDSNGAVGAFGGNGNAGGRGEDTEARDWRQEGYAAGPSASNRYRDEDSSDEEDEVALDRKPRHPIVTPARPSAPLSPTLTSPRSNPATSPTINLFDPQPSTSHRPAPPTPRPYTTPAKPTSTATPTQLTTSQTHLLHAQTLSTQGQHAAAQDAYTLALEALPPLDPIHSPRLLTQRATTRIQTGDYKGCVADCDAVLGIQGDDLEALVVRARAWEGLERWVEAVGDWERVLRVDAGSLVAREGVGRAKKGVKGGHLGEVAGGGGPVVVQPMSKAAEKAVERAVGNLRAQNESLEREEEEKFRVKEAIEAKVSFHLF